MCIEPSRFCAVCISIWSIFGGHILAAMSVDRSVSPSGEFVIYGSDRPMRAAVSERAEQIKSNLLALLRRRDDWQSPIVINLEAPQTNLPELPPTALRVTRNEAGLKLQLDLIVSEQTKNPDIEVEIYKAVLLEMSCRKKTTAGSEDWIEPPNWLVEGMAAAAPGRDRSRLVEALRSTNRVTPLEDFLLERPELLDSAARLLHRSYSLALVQMLFDLPEGRKDLSRYVDNLASSSSEPLRDLRAAFPILRGGNTETLWRTAVAQLAGSTDHELLSFAQSDAKLDELLETNVSDPARSIHLQDLCARTLTSAEAVRLRKLGQDLLLLAARANPLLRPVIQNYEQFVLQLAAGKNRGALARLKVLNSAQTSLSARMEQIDDYMNWFEATKLQTSSGLFDDYRTSSDGALQASRRTDPLSIYLDAMEQEF
jgi:hypothetical protein